MDNIVDLEQYKQAQNLENNQKSKKKKRRLKKKWRVVLMILVLIVALYALMHSSIFTLKNVLVEGNVNIASSKIIQLAEIQNNVNLFDLDKGDLKKKIKNYTFIEDVSFSYVLPDTLVINVKEKESLGFIVADDGYIQFDKDGIVLAVTNSMGNYNLPVITGVDLKEIPSPGGKVESKKFLQVLEILKNSQSDVLSNLAEINMSGVDVLAYTYQGVEIKIGNNDEIKSRMHNLSDIMLNITENNIDVNTIEYIDVRFDSVPTIKFKE